MNADIKTRWLAALRNPDAKQGRNVLGRPNGERCCLGVLCDIAVEDGIIDPPSEQRINTPGGRPMRPRLLYDIATTVLPERVIAWAGLRGGNPQVTPGGAILDRLNLTDQPMLNRDGTAYLAELNDAGATFTEIADMIEASL